jgi:hypothetical protein
MGRKSGKSGIKHPVSIQHDPELDVAFDSESLRNAIQLELKLPVGLTGTPVSGTFKFKFSKLAAAAGGRKPPGWGMLRRIYVDEAKNVTVAHDISVSLSKLKSPLAPAVSPTSAAGSANNLAHWQSRNLKADASSMFPPSDPDEEPHAACQLSRCLALRPSLTLAADEYTLSPLPVPVRLMLV